MHACELRHTERDALLDDCETCVVIKCCLLSAMTLAVDSNLLSTYGPPSPEQHLPALPCSTCFVDAFASAGALQSK